MFNIVHQKNQSIKSAKVSAGLNENSLKPVLH